MTHALQVRCLLIEPFPESALNEEAGKLLMEDYEAYAKHARLMTSVHAAHGKRCGSDLHPAALTQSQLRPMLSGCSEACEAYELVCMLFFALNRQP